MKIKSALQAVVPSVQPDRTDFSRMGSKWLESINL